MRIRSIKPEFWSSDDITRLPWDERLLFIGLWSYVADSGVGRDNDRLITSDLFPLEEDPLATLAIVRRGLASLAAAGLITRYRVKNKRYLHIASWADHQKIDRPTRSPFPPPTCDDAQFDEPSTSPHRTLDEPSLPGSRDLGSKGAREQGSKGPSPDKSAETDAPTFEEFWDTYDKKLDRKRSHQKYRAALKRSGVTPELILAAAATYIARQRSTGKHPDFTKDPATWLSGECWENERPTQSRPGLTVLPPLPPTSPFGGA